MHPGYAIGAVRVCREPVDFRKQINGLAAIVEQELGLDPFAAAVYVFTNHAHNRLKILYWDRNGFCLWQKRLEKEHFVWARGASDTSVCDLTARELEWLLVGLDIWSRPQHKELHYRCAT